MCCFEQAVQKQIYSEKFLCGMVQGPEQARVLASCSDDTTFHSPCIKTFYSLELCDSLGFLQWFLSPCDRGPWSLVLTESHQWALTPSLPHTNLEQACRLLGFGCCLLCHASQVCLAQDLCPEPHII